MGELRRFIKNNNLIMRITSLILTIAILASALVYFGDEKMDNVSATGGGSEERDYMEFIVQRIINGLQSEFNILEIVPYQGVGEFRYYANDKSVENALEAKQELLRDMYGTNHLFTDFGYTISQEITGGTTTYSVTNSNTFTSYVVPEYKELIDEVIKVNTVEANKLTESDFANADLIIINTGTSNPKVVESYKTFSGDTTKVYTKDGVEITDYTKITYDTYEEVDADSVQDEGDVTVTTTKKLYFTNENNWPAVYAFYDTRTDGTSVAMPGTVMTHVEGNVYCIELPSDAYRIGFSNGTTNHSIPPVTIQEFDKVLYGGNWYDYPLILNPSKYPVTMPTDEFIEATGEAEATQGAVYTVTLTPAEGYVILDDTVTVTIGESNYEDFLYNSKTGEIAIPSEAVTADIVINATTADITTLSQYTVALPLPTDTNIVSVGETTATQGKLYTATLSAVEGYTLPEEITVKVDGTAITTFSYNKETGEIVIPVSAVTGNIVIEATAVAVVIPEFAYISRDMSWDMCEKLLEYITKGRNLEISNGVVENNVLTPVVIDGDGLATLDKTSNIYKLIYIYRMCNGTNWDALKPHLKTYDATGKRYRTTGGIITAAINDVVEWKTGEENPVKAALGTSTTYIEADPTKTNHLSNNYWVYTNSNVDKNWTIPLYYNESLISDSSYNNKVTKIGNSYKSYNVLKYLLGAKSGQIYSFSKKLRVLEIQPCNSFDYDTVQKIRDLGVAFLREDAANWDSADDYEDYISIDYVTTNALNGMTVDIASNYDVVIIGDNIELLTKDSNGETIYNDRSLNGYIYLAFGDLLKISTFLMGFLPDEYIELPSNHGKNVKNISNSAVWTAYLHSVLNDGIGTGDYVIHDLYAYYKTNVGDRYVTKTNSNGGTYRDYLADNNGKIDNESFYMDYALGNTRIADNDITDITKQKLAEFVETGNPIIVADCVYNADPTKLYPTSDMYNFADEILGINDANGNRIGVRSNVVKKDNIGRAVAYLGTTAPEISFLTGNVDVITRSDQKDASTGKYTFTRTTKSDMPLKPVEPQYTSGVGSAVKTFNTHKLYYKFRIYGVAGKQYTVKLLIDKNNDGVYKDSPTSGNENEVYYSETVTLGNTRSVVYEIASELSEDFAGMLSWKIEVEQVKETPSDPTYKVEEIGYSAIYREELKTIKVLQVTPGTVYRDSNGNVTGGSSVVHLLLDSEKFRGLFEDVKHSVGYDIQITTKTVTEFNQMYNSEAERYVSGSDAYGYKSTRNQIKGYDMILLGFSDSFNGEDISNNYGAVDNIIDFVEAGNAMFLTHDTLSWRSTPNYNSAYLNSDGTIKSYGTNQDMYNVNVNGDANTGAYKLANTSPTLTFKLRNLMGMDKYGVTLTEAERIAQGKEIPMYADGYDKPNYMESNYVREIQGYNHWIIWRSNFTYRLKNNQSDVGKNYFGVRPFQNGDYLYYNRDSQGDYLNNVDNMTAKKVVNLNEGPITKFPYNIGTELTINETHGQYFELDMEDEEVVVWYTLAQGDTSTNKTTTSKFYEATAKDASNNYYIYSKGNITYSGAGHGDMNGSSNTYANEYKLFVNTIVKAIAGSNTKPAIKLINGSVVGDNTFVVYVDASNSAADYHIDFMAVDPDMISYATSNYNVSLVGIFARAEVYWKNTDGTLVKIKDRDYQATDRYGNTSITTNLKNGMEQNLKLGSTLLTQEQLNQIQALVTVPNGSATFVIEVEDDAQSVSKVEVQLRIRDLFNMN